MRNLGYPNTREEIDALPYVPFWGHWELQAWSKGMGVKLASVPAPYMVDRSSAFRDLDIMARAVLTKSDAGHPDNVIL